MKNTFLYSALLCIALAGLYALFIAPRFTIRIPQDWAFEAEYLGGLVYIDASQKIPEKPQVNVYKRSMKVVEWNRNRAIIEDVFLTRDVNSGELTWSSTLRFTVNPTTGAILSHPGHPEAVGAQYILPSNTQKRTYRSFNYALWPYSLEFEREDKVAGVEIYVFTYKGVLDFTELYKLAESVDALEGVPGDVKLMSFDYYNEIWVEPRTGEIVHMEDISPGDYWVDGTTGEKIKLVSIWSGLTTGNTDLRLMERVKTRLIMLDLHCRWVPGILLGLGCLFLLWHTFLYFGVKKENFKDR